MCYRENIKLHSNKIKRKCVFLDRDGTINKECGHVTNANDFIILNEAYEAIRIINESGFLAIVVTNQSGIARGYLTFEQLAHIHHKMETLLSNNGCYIDGLYFCPHYPDENLPGGICELKVSCECRKPKPGLFEKANSDYNIDFNSSFMIGDSDSDIIAAKTLGIKTGKVGGRDFESADFYGDNILVLVRSFMKHFLRNSS